VAAADKAAAGLLVRFDAGWGRLLSALALLACVLVAVMVVVICGDVLVRNLRMGSLSWANEVAEYTLYLSTFLSAPWLLRQGAHVRMDLALKVLPQVAAWRVEIVADVIAVLACAALTVACGKAALASAKQGSMVFKILVFPEWWLITPACVLFGVLTVECLLRLRRQWVGPKTIREEATSVA